jgi:hypothetical protein
VAPERVQEVEQRLATLSTEHEPCASPTATLLARAEAFPQV